MRISADPPIHLTYCLNVHPGETWAENLAAIRDYAIPIAAAVADGQPFGLGLRLGHIAAADLGAPGELDRLRAFLDESGLYAFTINGFPYGPVPRGPRQGGRLSA